MPGADMLAALKMKSTPGPAESTLVSEADRIAQSVREERKKEQRETCQSWDWAAKYKQFDDWAEEEAYQEKVRQEKQKQEVEKQRQQIGGCSHDHSAERKLMDTSTEEKIKQCEGFRTHGNAWFEEGQFFRASEQYQKVTIWLDYTFPETEELQKAADAVHLPALLNLTICRLKMADYRGVLESSRHALELDSKNIKALYAKAKAERCTTDFDAAGATLQLALELAPDQPDIRKEYALLQNSLKAYQLDSKMQAKAMFGQPPKPSTTEKGEELFIQKRSEELESQTKPWQVPTLLEIHTGGTEALIETYMQDTDVDLLADEEDEDKDLRIDRKEGVCVDL